MTACGSGSGKVRSSRPTTSRVLNDDRAVARGTAALVAQFSKVDGASLMVLAYVGREYGITPLVSGAALAQRRLTSGHVTVDERLWPG